jgi:hypothetical protein
MYLVYLTVPYSSMQSALYINTLYANFQLHCSSHAFPQCGMRIYVTADIVTLDAPNATSHFFITLHYTYLHYVHMHAHILSLHTLHAYTRVNCNLITKASIMCKYLFSSVSLLIKKMCKF